MVSGSGLISALCRLPFESGGGGFFRAPQHRSVAWHHFRSGEAPIVAVVHPPAWTGRYRRFGTRASLVVIDTAPRASAGALAVSKVANLVFIPCRPSPRSDPRAPSPLPMLPG